MPDQKVNTVEINRELDPPLSLIMARFTVA